MIVEYDGAGRIFHIVSDPIPQGLVEVLAEMGRPFVLTDQPCTFDDHYVFNGQVIERPEHPSRVVATGKSLILKDAEDCEVKIEVDGEKLTVTGSQIDFDEPGSSKITITPPWPFQEKVLTVENQ